MYECGNYRGVLIAALIPLLVSVPLRSRGLRVDQATRNREFDQMMREQEARHRNTQVVLNAWEFDHPEKECPDTVDEIDKYTVDRHAQDHRKLKCESMGLRSPMYLIVEEGDGKWAGFDPGEAKARSHLQEEAKLKRDNWPELGTMRKRGWYKLEAYPAWTRAHPGKECPATLDELNVYIGVNDSLDFWGHPLEMQCGPASPTDPGGFFVTSAGADGIFDTIDDLPRH